MRLSATIKGDTGKPIIKCSNEKMLITITNDRKEVYSLEFEQNVSSLSLRVRHKKEVIFWANEK